MRTITVKMAKPSQEDFDALHDFLQGLESIVEEGLIGMDEESTEATPEAVREWLESQWNHVGHVWQRVLWAGSTAIHNCCDPNADVLEWHPKVVRLLEACKAMVPEGWADGSSMDHMPGIMQARAAIAAMEDES